MSAHPPIDERFVPPALRPDLIVTRQVYEQRTFYVIKDPISLQYFRLPAQDYFLAALFDGKRSFVEIRATYTAQFPHLRLEFGTEELDERILSFINDLALLHFLQVKAQGLKDRLKSRRRSAGFSGWVTKLFFSRFSIFDPDALFTALERPLRWIWTKATMWTSIVLIVLACTVFVANYSRIAPSMTNFFTLHNLVLVWATTILIKSIHELGHGVTCKHFGGEVHEVGIMLLVFTPYFFVNVSDSWVMPRRRDRILISAAGIYVELILAAFATFLWAIVQPGALQQMLYNVIVIASFSTIVFNANPLMRFDGYYIMTDLMEVPNLSTKSRAFIANQLKRLLFGAESAGSMARLPLPTTRMGLFYFYAVASFLYGYFVIYQLTRYMSYKLAPYGLENLGIWLSVSALLAWIVLPLCHFVRGLHLTSDDGASGGRLRRLSLLGGGVVSIFAALCFVPVQLSIKRALAVDLVAPASVRAEVGGFVRAIYVGDLEQTKAGQLLATLSNREVEQQYASGLVKAQIADSLTQRAMAADKPVEVKQAESTRSQVIATAEESRLNRERLGLRAPSDGVVLTADLKARLGKYLKPGELFCEVAPLDRMRVRIPLSEKEVRYVRKGQTVLLRTYAFPDRLIAGKIADDPVMFSGKELPAVLSARRQGDVATGLDRDGREVPLVRTFEAQVQIDNKDGFIRGGMSGRARILAGTYPLGALIFQSLLNLVSLDYRF